MIVRHAKNAQHVLEVGCSTGYILYGLKQFRYEVTGTDISPKALQCAKEFYGLEHLYSAAFPPPSLYGSFDVIIMSHLIEHVTDPKNLIDEAIKFLKEEGILIIVTPHIDSFGYKIFKNHYPTICPPFHLNFFNKNSIQYMLREFEIVELKTESTKEDGNPIHNFGVAIANLTKVKEKLKKRLLSEPKDEEAPYTETRLFTFIRSVLRILQLIHFPFFFVMDKLGLGENILVVAKKRSTH
ncbi:class I SAM-dependent methyltransferase [Thermospira aquatica]|uniref:Class I SAM-dependent methyltransferase n=1 Tax=Thermospira aquatica TaxID=2828656 RepID=A0AAX3BAG2_9SPIR|nr:class I SAM-dependent methyltransferase [Thermospira aquatica]URA09248.1 class I SAM-dependent methyltransferase [Thermospira aquatica]